MEIETLKSIAAGRELTLTDPTGETGGQSFWIVLKRGHVLARPVYNDELVHADELHAFGESSAISGQSKSVFASLLEASHTRMAWLYLGGHERPFLYGTPDAVLNGRKAMLAAGVVTAYATQKWGVAEL